MVGCFSWPRCILLWLLVMSMQGCPIIEQPSSSMMNQHDRFCWLLDLLEKQKIRAAWVKASGHLVEVYRCNFWMKHYGHPTPKRSILWSTSWPIGFFNRGKLSRDKHTTEFETTIRYTDGSGRTRFKASRFLKQTQNLGRASFLEFLLASKLFFSPCPC